MDQSDYSIRPLFCKGKRERERQRERERERETERERERKCAVEGSAD